MPRTVRAYRQRNGYDQAIVTLRDSVIKRARDYWLGPFDSPSSSSSPPPLNMPPPP